MCSSRPKKLTVLYKTKVKISSRCGNRHLSLVIFTTTVTERNNKISFKVEKKNNKKRNILIVTYFILIASLNHFLIPFREFLYAKVLFGSLSDYMKEVIGCPCRRGRITEILLQQFKMCIRHQGKKIPVKGENVSYFFPDEL